MGEIISRADIIAKEEPLTEATLLKEIFGLQEDTFRIRMKKKYVLKQLKDIAKNIKQGNKQFVIYCFIRLWNECTVLNYNFRKVWPKDRYTFSRYKLFYLKNNIEKIQKTFIVV